MTTESIVVTLSGGLGFAIAKEQVEQAVASAVASVDAARDAALGDIDSDLQSARGDLSSDRSAALSEISGARTNAIQAITMAGSPASNALKSVFVDTLPVGPIPMAAGINNPLRVSGRWDGSKVVLDRSPYQLIDFERDKTLTVLQRHVSYAGSNANDGLSQATAWKTLDYALSQVGSSNMVINIHDRWLGYLSLDVNVNDVSGRVKLKGAHPQGTTLAAMREGWNLAHFNWSPLSTAAGRPGRAYRSISGTKYFKAMYDGNYRDANGVPLAMQGLAVPGDVETTPGTFAWDAGAGALTVYMTDGRVPDPDDGWIYSDPAKMAVYIRHTGAPAAGALLVENLEIMVNSGSASTSAGIYWTPATTGAATKVDVGLKNVRLLGHSNRGVMVYDPQTFVMEDCIVDRSTDDAVSIQSWITAANGGAQGTTFYLYNVKAYEAATAKWLDQRAMPASPSINLFTAHMGAHGWIFNCSGSGCEGAAVAMVNGCKVACYNVSVSRPRSRTGTTPWPVGFWHDNSVGPTTGFLALWGCATHDGGDPLVQLISNVAQVSPNVGEVRVAAWRGQTIGAVTGPLKDWAGVALPVA